MSLNNNLPLSQQLIPTTSFLYGFTTCISLKLETDYKNLELVPLDDKHLGVHKVSSGTTHEVVSPPLPSAPSSGSAPEHTRSSCRGQNPSTAWEALYPQGSINPSGPIPGGFGFYLSGPPSFSERLENAKEAIFSYRMMLQPDWEWVKGGKLPGVFGGVGDLAYGCTGGRKEKRCQCFNLRPMWRQKSMGELYAYMPLTSSNASQLSSVPPLSVENSDYGFSVGRGSFTFQPALGAWIAIAFRVKLNDVGVNNGLLELFVNGQSALHADGLSFRETEAGKIKGMHFQTFFGGHAQDWASPKDQRAWFTDVTGVVLQ